MENTNSRQDNLFQWLRDNCVTVRALADHCGKSPSRICSALRADTVPVDLRESLAGFKTETGKHIPVSCLPQGKDIPPGPKIGWKEEARRSQAEAG
ncbi:hypothetical protein ACR42D_10630 [Desulfovibrio caledoniensis]